MVHGKQRPGVFVHPVFGINPLRHGQVRQPVGLARTGAVELVTRFLIIQLAFAATERVSTKNTKQHLALSCETVGKANGVMFFCVSHQVDHLKAQHLRPAPAAALLPRAVLDLAAPEVSLNPIAKKCDP